MLEAGAFYFFAGFALLSASFLLIEARTPISTSLAFSALGLAIAGVLQGAGADFIALAEWILSLGAALALFVSSVMVSGVRGERFYTASPLRVLAKLAGAVAAAVLVGLLVSVLDTPNVAHTHTSIPTPIPTPLSPGAANLGGSLFASGSASLPLLGLLLLVVLVGSVVLARRRLD